MARADDASVDAHAGRKRARHVSCCVVFLVLRYILMPYDEDKAFSVAAWSTSPMPRRRLHEWPVAYEPRRAPRDDDYLKKKPDGGRRGADTLLFHSL